MKAISLWEPYASFMALGLKINETRHWKTPYRGPLLIHAAKRKIKKSELESMKRMIFNIIRKDGFDYDIFNNLQYGKIVCMVNLVDCQKIGHENYPDPFSSDWKERAEYCFGNYDYGRYMWITENRKLFENPIPFKGSQGFFNVPDELINEQRLF